MVAACGLVGSLLPTLKSPPFPLRASPTTATPTAATAAASATVCFRPSSACSPTVCLLFDIGQRSRGCRPPWWHKLRCPPVAAQLQLQPPPYPLDSLEPHLSREAVEFHWESHHRGHVDSLNGMIEGTHLQGMALEDMVVAAYNRGDPLPPFPHAAQAWNHDFFWQSMRPGGGGKPSGKLMELIERDFGSFERMKEQFKNAAVTQFGSGWAWLAYKANRQDVGNATNPRPSEKDNKLVIAKTPNAVNPLVWDYTPLLAIDVWEHAYYIDYQNRRMDYVMAFLDKLVAWETVSSRLDSAVERAAERARAGEEPTQEANNNVVESTSPSTEMYLDSDADESEEEADSS